MRGRPGEILRCLGRERTGVSMRSLPIERSEGSIPALTLEGIYYLGEGRGSAECGLRVRFDPVTPTMLPRTSILCAHQLCLSLSLQLASLTSLGAPPSTQGCLERGKTCRVRPSRRLPGGELRKLGAFSVSPRWPLRKDKVLPSYLFWRSQTHRSRLRSSLPPEPEKRTT